MIIETIPISKIKPAEYNPRLDLKPGDAEYEKIKRSIEEFDLVEPLVWNKATGNLVGGHQRLKILIEKGVKEVQVSVVDIKDINREKALNIALNKVQGEWDNIRLAKLLQELNDDNFKIELTGFDQFDYENLQFLLKDDITDDRDKEWIGMPTYKSEDLMPWKQLIVAFETPEHYRAFQELIGIELTDKTKSVWFPPKERADDKNKRY